MTASRRAREAKGRSCDLLRKVRYMFVFGLPSRSAFVVCSTIPNVPPRADT